MDNQLNKRISKLEKTSMQTDKRLGNIEKLLTNHVAHQKIAIDLWLKRIIPLVAVLIPVLVALVDKLPDILFRPH